VGFGLLPTAVLSSVDVDGFIGRIRPTDFFTTPTRFVGGGSADLITRYLRDSVGLQADLTLNAVVTWDDLSVGTANSGIRNQVYSLQYDVALAQVAGMQLSLQGETGLSMLSVLADSVTVLDEDDTFLDVGLSLKPDNGRWNVLARFVDVGPDFFSIGAQTKRIDFSRSKTYFNRLGDRSLRRDVGLFDLSRDRALYTYQLFDRLMPYDPRFGNVMPYGTATPNRRGLVLSGGWLDAKSIVDLDASVALLQEIRGQGTTELRQYQQVRFDGSLDLAQLAGWQSRYQVNAGYQFESTSRDGLEVEQVDFQTSLLEVGIEAEVFRNLHLMAGGYFLAAEGREILPVIRENNEVRDFQEPFVADENEALYGLGLRYDFKPDTYLTIQYQQSARTEAIVTGAQEYNLGQFFALYIMNF
jgi:hypothetical protein